MRRIITVAVAMLALAGCSTSSPKCETAPSKTSAPAIAAPAVIEVGGSGPSFRMACNTAKGFVPVEVAKGSHDNTSNGTNYVFEVSQVIPVGTYKAGEQKEVKLYLQPPAGVSIPSAIVRTAGSADQELAVNLAAGGRADFYLLTANYAYLSDYYFGYPINSVILCTKHSS